MSVWLRAGLVVLGLSSFYVFAEENCSHINDPTARLACFDREFPRSAPVPEPGKASEAVSESPDLIKRRERARKQAQRRREREAGVQSHPVVGPGRSTRPGPGESSRDESGGLFGWLPKIGGKDKKEEYSGVVVDLLKREKQRMAFQLDNGQIWIQSSARSLTIKKGDEVTIRSATGGGYIMRTENGASTRVDFLPE